MEDIPALLQEVDNLKQKLTEHPGHSRHSEYLAAYYRRLGMAYAEKDDFEKALNYYQGSRKIYNDLITRNPHDLGPRTAICKLYASMAELYRERNYLDEAFEYYNTVYWVWDAILSFHPNDPNYMYWQAQSCIPIGDVYTEMGKHEDALDMYTECMEIMYQLRNELPESPDDVERNIYAVTIATIKVADAYVAQGKLLALFYEDYIKCLQVLVDDYPDKLQYRPELLESYERIESACTKFDSIDFLKLVYERGIEYFQQRIEKKPDEAFFKEGLQKLQDKLEVL